MLRPAATVDQWKRLDIYRHRYPIEERLQPLIDLEKSIDRRRFRSTALARRLADLEKQITEVRDQLRAVETEIRGSRSTGALLIEEIIDQIRVDMAEAWSPTPVRGFRVWRIQDNKVMGNQVHWPSPTLVSECLREIPGEDLPHPVATCGPPACGIYAVKDLSSFGTELGTGAVDRSVVGVVAMTGKVVEHEEGYRSQCATAVAVVARYGAMRLITDDSETISALFGDPFGALARSRRVENRADNEAREFLESMRSKEEEWI